MPKTIVGGQRTSMPPVARRTNGGLARRILFGGIASDSRRLDAGRLILRVIAGLGLMYGHGLGKLPPSEGFIGGVERMGLPLPHFFAWVATFAEVAGATLLILGLLTRPVSLLLVGHFTIIALVAHAGADFGTREKAILYGAAAIFYLLSGAGRYSLDALTQKDH